MSRGLGKLQRAIMTELNGEALIWGSASGWSPQKLAAWVYHGGRWRTERVTRAQMEATRRALKGLVDTGLLIREPPNKWHLDVKFRPAGWTGLHYTERLRTFEAA
jgi:hypothetical protein